MSDKEKKFHRARSIYYIFSAIMAISAIAAILGVIIVFFNQKIGVDLIAYGVVIAFVASSFYFISRTRFLKAKVAYQAIQMAKTRNPGNATSE